MRIAAGRVRLGVDLGGTKTEIIALDGNGQVLARRRVASPQGSYEATLGTVTDLVLGLEHELGITGTVGIGTPGSLSKASGLLRGSNSVWLNGRPLRTDLEAALKRDIRLTNDANCFALSEASDGAGQGANIVFGVILGTGVGGGVVVNGTVLDGANAIAGEWGHNPLPWPVGEEHPGPLCWCGRRGCIETWLSGPGMARDHRAVTGSDVSPPAIVAAANAGDATCDATLDRYVHRLARGLAHVINIVDPDVIVLGGGMSNVGRLYGDVVSKWGQWVFSDRVVTRLARAVHGDSSGVRGAAWLWEP